MAISVPRWIALACGEKRKETWKTHDDFLFTNWRQYILFLYLRLPQMGNCIKRCRGSGNQFLYGTHTEEHLDLRSNLVSASCSRYKWSPENTIRECVRTPDYLGTLLAFTYCAAQKLFLARWDSLKSRKFSNKPFDKHLALRCNLQ